MANLPQSSQSDSMDSLTVTREQFRLAKKDELEYLAQAFGNVSGSYTTETVDPNAVTLQGTPTLATAAEPAAADSSLRLVNTRWVKQNAASTGTTAPATPVRGQVWIDTSQDPPVMNVWDDTPPPGAWVPTGGGASVEIGATPPAAPTAGDMWWNSDDGRLYIYYTDVDSSQWVDASPGGGGGGGASVWTETAGALHPATLTNRVLVGTSSTYTDVVNGAGGYTGPLWLATNDSAGTGPFISTWNGDSGLDQMGTSIVLSRSKGNAIGTHGVMADGNAIGTISFNASDGSKFVSSAIIRAAVDGTPGANDMPGRLSFSTTSSGSATPAERMRVGSQGTTQIASNTNNPTLQLRYKGSPDVSNDILQAYRDASIGAGALCCKIISNGDLQNTNNAYGALSDIKLKENIVDAKSQWDDIKGLRVVNYNFKKETGHQTFKQLGLIAQEVEQVCPGLVGETKDMETVEVPVLDADGKPVLDEDGKPQVTHEERETGEVTKNVNYSILYMKAVGALQEALTRIEQLETKVAALEGGAH